MSNEKPSLIAAMAEVMATVRGVAKRGRNDFHRYDYATEADIADAVRHEMAVRGVMLLPAVDRVEWREVHGKNGPQKIATLFMSFTWTNGAEERKQPWVGEGQDSGDKAVYKAMTGAEKYILLKTFLIPTGDDPEQDERGSGDHGRKAMANAMPKQEPPKQEQPKQAPPRASTVELAAEMAEWAESMRAAKTIEELVATKEAFKKNGYPTEAAIGVATAFLDRQKELKAKGKKKERQPGEEG